MAKKGELVVVDPPTQGGNLQVDTSVKFEGKITNSDLMDALIFQIEEDLLAERKELMKEYTKLSEASNKKQVAYNKTLTDISVKYKNKDIDKFLTLFNSFVHPNDTSSRKAYVTYTTQFYPKTEKDAEKIVVTASLRDGSYFSCAKTFEQKVPANVKDALAGCTAAQEVSKKNADLQREVNEKIAELPRLKKRLKAKFVQTMLNGNINDRKVMFDDLKSELTKHVKKQS